jgi:CRP-like cAMP-binding protein
MPPKIRTQAFLANLPLFRDLAPAEIDRLAAGTTELFVPRGEIVFQRGDPCVGVHAIVYGQVKLAFVTPQGDEKVVEIISAGLTFGEALMFMDKPYIVMAQALSDTMLLHVGRDVVFHGIEHDAGFARRMLAGLSRRVHALMADVESYSLQSGTQRVIGYLLRQESESADGEAGWTVRLPASKSVVASRLNLTPEHFSRILHELADRGLIAVEGRDVRIVDAQKLRDYTV